jgi:acyl-CoA reductase-like NAD-dependent aldehyde dehydrogenase
VDKVTFTGSARSAQYAFGGRHPEAVTLELGGKSPNIVFADADFETAVEGSCNGVFWNQGEICSAGTRVYVDRAIYDEALNAFVERARDVRLGDGLDEETTMGPLVSGATGPVERYVVGKKATLASGAQAVGPRRRADTSSADDLRRCRNTDAIAARRSSAR